MKKFTCTESAVGATILSRDTSHISKSESCDWSSADSPLRLVGAGSLPDLPLFRLINQFICNSLAILYLKNVRISDHSSNFFLGCVPYNNLCMTYTIFPKS